MGDAEEETGLDKAQKIVLIVETLVGVAVTLWWLWDMQKDDPLGLPAQITRWWDARKRDMLRRRREARELAEWAIDLDLFLLREIERWKEHHA